MGAGGSLIAAGVVSLLLFSSLLAFRAWPDGTPVRPDGSYALSAPAAKADGRAAAGPVVALVVAPAPAARRETGDRVRVRDRAGRRRTTSTSPRGVAPQRPGASTPVASAPVAAGADSTAPAPSARPEPKPDPKPIVTPPSIPAVPPGAVQTVTDTGRSVVDQVTAPLPLPPAVKEPVGTLLDTAGGAARTVDETLAPLLP
jgi:hypothetical protein